MSKNNPNSPTSLSEAAIVDAVIAFSTIDSLEGAKKIARTLVESKLAACINIIPKIHSIYEWKNEICEEEEFLLIIKTQAGRLEELKVTLGEIHPYDVPELIACPVKDGLADYLEWIFKNTQ